MSMKAWAMPISSAGGDALPGLAMDVVDQQLEARWATSAYVLAISGVPAGLSFCLRVAGGRWVLSWSVLHEPDDIVGVFLATNRPHVLRC